MGFIIKPNTGGTTYPNISDVVNVVTINPSVAVAISSDIITIEGNSLTYGSPSSGTLDYNDFTDVNFNNTNVSLKNDNVYIANSGGKVGFFSDTNSAVQANAIANATLLNVDVKLNAVLAALRSYGLIAT